MNINFDNLEYNKKSDIVYDTDTGEIIDDDLVIEKAIEEKVKQERKDKAKKKELKRKIGKVDKKETHYLNWKSGKKVQFIKIYRTELREYMKTIKLSPNAGLFLFCIQTYIEMETNRIANPNGSNFSNKEFEEMTGLSDKTLKNAINELEDKHFITRVGNRQAREIYFNPYLMCAGKEVLIETVDLFKDYRPITEY